MVNEMNSIENSTRPLRKKRRIVPEIIDEKFESWLSSFETEGINLPNTVFYFPGGLYPSAIISCAVLQYLIDHNLRPDGIVGSSAPGMSLGLLKMGFSPQQAIEIFNSFDINEV
jgi:hypothetical protein